MALLSIVLFTQLVCVIEALILPCDFFENREFSETIRCCVVRNTSKSAREENTYYCMPRFMIIGTQKSGTTALAGFLSQHPMVFFPSEKEVHFFDKNASTPSTNVTSDRDSSSTVSLLAYMKHFRITEATAARAVGVMPHHQPLEEGQKFPFADVGSTSLNESAMSEQPVLLQEYAESSESGVLQSTVDREPAIPPRRRSRHRKVQATPSPQLGAGANAAGNTAEQLFFGDATPFYMASRLSCQRIAKMFPGSSVHAAALVSAPPMTVNNMINDTDRRDSTTNLLYQPTASTNSLASASPAMKFITILRDPIERLYSEYHMKRR